MGTIDAVTIGGGLAGAAFALELARHGRRVLVLERTRAPHLKVCGDFLSAKAVELVAYLGVDVGALGARPIMALELETGKRSIKAALPFTARGLSRRRLDEALLVAAEDAGADVARSVRVTGLSPADGHVVIRTEGKVFRARAAALASGKHNLRGWPRPAGTMTAFKMPLAMSGAAQDALASSVYLGVYQGGYLGACLIEDGAATLCWLADRGLMQELGGNWQAQLTHLAQGSRRLGELLDGAVPLAERPAAISALPFGYRRRAAIADNVFPVGDQLAVIPSFTGDGTCLALASGIMAARAVLGGVAAPAFQAAFLASLKPQFRWATALDLSAKSGIARRAGMSAAGLFPGLATGLVQATRFRGEVASGVIPEFREAKMSGIRGHGLRARRVLPLGPG